MQFGAELSPKHTSYYTLVRSKLVTPNVCLTANDYATLEGLTSYFPIEEGEKPQGDEIVVCNESQVLPRFIVHYTTTVSKFAVSIYQP